MEPVTGGTLDTHFWKVFRPSGWLAGIRDPGPGHCLSFV